MPRDGKTMGEIMVRGNTVMLGYLKDPKATADAFRGGWMHTGDLAVEHPDGYVEIKDRAKDIIISGGENISSVEVEIALYKHPAVQLAAVVARPGREMGRDALRLRAAEAGRERDRRRDHRLLPRSARAFQGAEIGGVRAAADDRDRQDPEIRAARAGPGALTGATAPHHESLPEEGREAARPEGASTSFASGAAMHASWLARH